MMHQWYLKRQRYFDRLIVQSLYILYVTDAIVGIHLNIVHS